MTLKKKDLENTVGKGENASNQHFLRFLVFSSLSKQVIIIFAMFNLSSANASNLNQSKNLSFGKELMILIKRPFENNAEKRDNADNYCFLLFLCFHYINVFIRHLPMLSFWTSPEFFLFSIEST